MYGGGEGVPNNLGSAKYLKSHQLMVNEFLQNDPTVDKIAKDKPWIDVSQESNKTSEK